MPEKAEEEMPSARFTFDVEPHGVGGFAKVLKGRDNLLERDVAVKVLSRLVTDFADPEQERFKREARVLAQLSHPNIPAVYDVTFSPDTFWIVCEFIEGKTLRQLIDEEGSCDVGRVRTWFQQLASALDHAHALEIVHRDVKPENIIVTPDGESAYLVDFGIALSADDAAKLTESGFTMGSVGYMSPEQIATGDTDWRSDIYSLGVCLYEALSGEAIPIGDYQELAIANEAIPPQLDDLIRDCLLPKDQRPQSAKTFSNRLAGALKPVKPLSDVLAYGRLHEVASALEELNAADFASLPAGQRVLVLSKASDLVQSDDTQLEVACARFLDLLVTRGLLLDKDEYRKVVGPAIEWGFERTFGGFTGRPGLRRTLEGAAYDARGGAHEVLREEFAQYLGAIDFNSKDNWYYRAVRPLLETLLANPSCTTGAEELVALLGDVNNAQREKASQAPE